MNTKNEIELLGRNLENSDDHIAILKDIFKPLNQFWFMWDDIMVYLDVVSLYLVGKEALYRRDKDEERADMCAFLRTYLNGGYWVNSSGVFCLSRHDTESPDCTQCAFCVNTDGCNRQMAHCEGVWYKII